MHTCIHALPPAAIPSGHPWYRDITYIHTYIHTCIHVYRLFHLQQYPLDIPGTGIYHPNDVANLMGEPKGREGTATSFTNALMSKPETLAELSV
jgi:hypothetical protein